MATGEIDLNGLDEQIKKVDASMNRLVNDTGQWGADFAKMNFQKLGSDVSSLTRNLSSLSDLLSKGEGLRGGARAVEEYTKLMQTLLNVATQMQAVKFFGNFDSSKIENNLRNATREAEGFYNRVVKISQLKINEITSYSNAQNVNDAKRAELKIQEEINRLIQQGSAKGVNTLLAMGRSVSNLQQIISGLRIVQNNVNQSTAEGKQRYDELGAAIRLAERELARMQGRSTVLNGMFSNLKGIASQIALSFGIMTGVFGAANFFRQLYSITSNFQLQQKALAAIVDNAREANILFKQMQTLAVESPIKLMDLNKYAKQLAAFRIETTELYGSLKMLADISVGVGVDMDRLILAFGQVKAANYLRGQELRQFSEAGVNILGGLREYYEATKGIKLSLNDIFDMVSKRKVLFEDVEAVLKRMTQQGGAFYNMQLIQSQTLYGQVQKLSDLFQIEMNKMGSAKSGTLLAFVKVVQFLIKNLQTVVILLTSIAAATGIQKLVFKISAAVAASKTFNIQLSKSIALVKTLGNTNNLQGVAGAIKNITKSTSLLTMVLKALALVIGGIISAITANSQKRKQAAEDARLEIEELNRRLVEIKRIEGDFKEKTAYEERLAALQELVEKAKEYRMNMQLGEITPANIEAKFNEASNKMKKYVSDVQGYRAMLSETISSKESKALNEMASPFQDARQQAENYFNYLTNHTDLLNDKQKEIYDELSKMREAQAEGENVLIEKYQKNNRQFEKYFLKRINDIGILREYAKELDYGKLAQRSIGTAEYLDVDFKGLDFIDQYEKAYNKLKTKLGKDLKIHGMDLSKWVYYDEDTLKKKLAEFLPVLIAAMQEAGEVVKEDIPDIVADLIGGEEGEKYRKIMADVILSLENGDTNLEDKTWQRLIKDVFGEEIITKEVNLLIKPIKEGNEGRNENLFLPSFASRNDGFVHFDENGNPVVDYSKFQFVGSDKFTKQVAFQSEKIQELYKNSKGDLDEFHKSLDNLYKETISAQQRYAKAVTQNQIVAINTDLVYSFKTQAEALAALNIQLKENEQLHTEFVWDLPKTSSGRSRTESMKSEYQSMIDFIKKLNTEYDKLRKDFSENTDKYWEGSFERIVKAYEGEFGQMPAKFKQVFKEIAKIDFTTKEGTIAGEKLVEGIINGAKNISAKEKKELLLKLQQTIGDLNLQVDLGMKKDADDRLKAHVQKMFDDYSLTVELKKLGIEGYEAADLFGINVTTLSQLQQRLEDLKERFIGQNMEKEYQKFMDKIVEINGKANLEMSKKYVKYLREEYDEIAKLQIEYMKKRAEVYSLPFEEGQQTAILENLQKEMNKKMRKLEWDEFKKSDFYIEMFNDLKNASTSSLEIMNEHLRKMKENMKDLSPTELKAISDEMRKIEEEWIRRNPFDGLIEGFKEIKKMRGDTTLKNTIDDLLGDSFDEKSFGARLDAAISVAQEKILDLNKIVSKEETLKKAAETRDSALEILGWTPKTLDYVDGYLKDLEKSYEEVNKKIKQFDLATPLSEDDAKALSEYNKSATVLSETIKNVSDLKSALVELGDFGTIDVEKLAEVLGKSKEELEEYLKTLKRLKDANDTIDEHKKRLEEASKQIKNFIESGKTLFDTIAGGLDILGVETNEVTDAWIEFGDQVLDTLGQIAEVMPEIANSFSDVGNEIEGAVENLGESNDWIGLIVAAVNLILKLVKALCTEKEYDITDKLKQTERAMSDLEYQAEKLADAFQNAFDEDKIKIFNDKLISNYQAQIANLQRQRDLEQEKKHTDYDKLWDYEDRIRDLNDKINEQKESLIEALGGFGSVENMRSTAEEWASAWYDAFKETGDGLSALEDSFESFLDNIFKKQIMNKLSDKFFGDLFSQLDTIMVKEGGIMGNMDEFRNWVLAIRESFEGYSNEAEQITMALRGVAGLGGGLEGLSASIKGMTEDTANALVAYLNSIRFYVSEQNALIETLRDSLVLEGGTNPMLSQMRLVARNTSAIQALFESVVAPNATSLNGACIKVAMM